MIQPLHICHVSILNPVTHPRIYAKLACSQRDLGYRVSIIGREDKKQESRNIAFYMIPHMHRLNWKRFLTVPFQILHYTHKIQADIYWIHTPELFWLGWYWKIKGKRVVYDVHEDYYKTIRYAFHYPYWIRKPLASFWRTLEKWWVKHLDAVVYAEECYDDMLNAGDKKKVILRNKFSKQNVSATSSISVPTKPYMLYSGTIAPAWGIWKTLEFWKNIYSITQWELVVAGFTFRHNLIIEILDYIEVNGLTNHFTLHGGTQMVAYPDIVELIRHCKAGIALYEVNPVIQGKIPTKFYEYMAFDKPLLFTADPFWIDFDRQYQLGVAYHEGEATSALLEELENWSCVHEVDDYAWESEMNRMRIMLRGLNRH